MQPFINEGYQVLGDNIYKFRVLNRMTQDDLASRSKVTGSYISQIERADLHKGITYTAIMKIANVFDVPFCVLCAKEPCPKYLECLTKIASVPIESH